MTTELVQEFKIEKYNEFRAKLGELEQENSSLVFNYEDPKGNKEARSHIYKLRQTKTAVDKVRKDEKQASLEYGRLVDSEAKEIIEKIEKMIDVHLKPIEEIETREKLRIQTIKSKIEELRKMDILTNSFCTSSQISDVINKVKSVEVDVTFAEFMAEATAVKDAVLASLNSKYAKAFENEEREQELAALKKAEEERKAKEREEQIKKEAEEKAKLKVEREAREQREKIEREKKDLEEREARTKRELEESKDRERLAEERRVKEAEEAKKREANAIEKAREDERKRQEQKEMAEAEAARLREANIQHQAKINNEILEDLKRFLPLADEPIKILIGAMAKGMVRHVKINY